MVNIPCRLPSRVNHRFLTDGKDTRKFLISKRMDYWCSFFPEKRTMVRPAFSQPCATAHQPNLVTQKTRLFVWAVASFRVCLWAKTFFKVLFLSFDFYLIETCFNLKIGSSAAQTILGHSLVPIRGDYHSSCSYSFEQQVVTDSR